MKLIAWIRRRWTVLSRTRKILDARTWVVSSTMLDASAPFGRIQPEHCESREPDSLLDWSQADSPYFNKVFAELKSCKAKVGAYVFSVSVGVHHDKEILPSGPRRSLNS
jgi:hypothetical protein